MTRWLFALLTLAGLAGVASATCFVRSRAVVIHKPAVVVRKAVVAEVVAVPVATFVPVATYGAVYTPPAPAPAPAAAPASELKAVLDAVRAIDERLRRLEGGGPPPAPQRGPAAPPDAPPPMPKAAGAAHPGLQVLATKCAACHEAKVSAEKGGGLTLFEGDALAKLTDRQLRRISSMTYSGKMPPKSSGVSLTDEEVGKVMEWIDSLK